jgi:RNA polymerase sigma-70 factor (ECF subfamily)
MDAGRRARDEWLALRCQAADPGAFEALIADFERPLFFYLLQLVGTQDQALDLLQETWIRSFKTFRKLKDPGALRAWLYTLAHGLAVDHVRRDQVRFRAEERFVDGLETNLAADLSSLSAAEIRSALAQLSAEHREVLVLHFLEDFRITEIANILGCPPGTVKSRIYHAKAQVRQILERGEYGTE